MPPTTRKRARNLSQNTPEHNSSTSKRTRVPTIDPDPDDSTEETATNNDSRAESPETIVSVAESPQKTAELGEIDQDEKEMRKKQASWTSEVYQHFQKVEIARDKNGNKLYSNGVLLYSFRCKINDIVKLRKATDSSTGNLLKHMNACAPRPNQRSIDIMQSWTGGYTRERMRWMIVQWIARCNRPYAIIEDTELREIFMMLCPKVEIPVTTTVSKDIQKAHLLMKPKLIELLENHKGAVHTALDAWSSKKASSYLGLTLQWCPDETDKITVLTLDLIRVPFSHTGQYLAEQVHAALCDFGISNKLMGLAGDNASNNDTMTSALLNLIPAWGGQRFRIRCFAHIINLVEQGFLLPFRDLKRRTDADELEDEQEDERLLKKLAALQEDQDEEDNEYEQDEDPEHQDLIAEEVAELHSKSVRDIGAMSAEDKFAAKFVLSKATGLAKRVAHSDTVQTAFLECCEREGLKPLMLKRPVATRWNTHFDCLSRQLLQKSAVVRLCDNAVYAKFKLDKYILSDDEWNILEDLKPALEIFERVTKHISQTQTVLIHQVIPIIDRLTDQLESLVENTAHHCAIRHGAKTALSVLDKYYSKTDESYIYRMAIILHPRFKMQYFASKEWPTEWIDEAIRITRLIWIERYKPMDGETTPVQAEELNEFDWFGPPTTTKSTDDALSTYLAQPPVHGCTMPLAYWQGQLTSRLTSPQLVRFAKDVLSSPATSVDVERLFSLSGKTVSPLRTCLNDSSVRATVVLNSWMKNPALSVEKQFTSDLLDGWKRGKNRRQSEAAGMDERSIEPMNQSQ